MNRDFPFRRALASAVLLPVSAMVALVAVLIWQVTSLMSVSSWVEHTDSVIRGSFSLNRHFLEAVVEFRGYLLTGDGKFLRGFTTHTEGIALEFDELCQLCKDNPTQANGCENLRYLVSRWGVLAREVIASPAANEGPQELLARLSPLVDTIRKTFSEFIQAEVALRARRVGDLQQSIHWFWRVIFSSLAIVAFVMAWFSRVQLLGVADHYERLKKNEQGYVSELRKSVSRLSQEIEERARVQELLRAEIELRRKAQAEAHRSAAILNAIHNSTEDAIYAKDLDGRLVAANPATLRTLGRSWADIEGRTHVELLGDTDSTRRTMETERRVIATGVPEIIEETIPREGTPALVFQSRKSLIRGADGRVFGIVGVSRDITDQKQRDRQLKMLAAIVENSTDFVAAASVDHKVVFVNAAGRKLVGLQAAEVEGTRIADYFTDEWRGRAVEEILPIVEKAGLWQGEVCFRHFKSGAAIPVIYSKFTVRDGEGNALFYATVTRDITELKRTENRLRESAARLAESNAELARFAFVASHDLKEPLRVISSYSQLLGREFRGKLGERADQYLHYIVESVQRMYELINGLLGYSHVGATKGVFGRVSTKQVVETALANLKTSMDESGAVVELAELPEVEGDSTQLVQLFQNLVANAIKYRSARRLPTIRISSRKENGNWLFSVSDNGIGIEREHHEKIFILFHRLHTKDEYTGTGIGLAVCKKIVERHGGKLWVDSKADEGSTFHFTLPEEKRNRQRTQ